MTPTGEPATRRASYHHGALREELLTACVALVEAEGIGAVSLRRVARAAGVSPGAPYHHFADRSALLGAISAQGFGLLTERLRTAREAAGDPFEALGALVRAYVLFAGERPAHFQVMFRPELSKPEKHPETAAAGDAAFQVLAEVVADCRRTGRAPAVDLPAMATLVWALAHGLAALWLDGPLQQRSARFDTTPEALTEEIARLVETAFATAARTDGRPR